MVAVAQLVERVSVEDEVAGSKPVSHPTFTPLENGHFRSLNIYVFIYVEEWITTI